MDKTATCEKNKLELSILVRVSTKNSCTVLVHLWDLTKNFYSSTKDVNDYGNQETVCVSLFGRDENVSPETSTIDRRPLRH